MSKVDEVKEKIRRFIKTTWVELFEDKPDVAYDETKLDKCARQIDKLYQPEGSPMFLDKDGQWKMKPV